jgi:hypothetical protein
VPFTAMYAGEQITSLEALNEAVERGLVGEPVNDVLLGAVNSNTFINLPVVLPGTTLEVGPLTTDVLPPRQVYGRGFLVDVFELGTKFGRQAFRNGFVPLGQASGLQTGVPAADGSLPTAIDSKLVFQYAIPTAAAAANTPNYSPLAFDVTVRLTSNPVPGVAPAAIVADGDLFKRAANGAISGAITAFFTTTVASFTIGTVPNNLQLQFEEGLP